MKHKRLWAGAAGLAAVAAGACIWATQPDSAAHPESKAPPVVRTEQVETLLQTALEQQRKQNFPGASRAYRRALELDPRSKVAWYGLGVLAQQNGNMGDAQAAYERALKIDPSFTSALFSEATLLKSSRPDQAVKLLKRATEAEPKATAIRMQLGLLLAEQGSDHEATQQFRRAVAADPSLLPQVPERLRGSVGPPPTPHRTETTG
ncbi:tetratricopeptide repeat protein [Streptomyces sp. MK7]|uniref:tetratricopeptide repeat protein n=1 Tax=Streptomyces sp. MK7 TaxID=3067635 RepID=UPI00292D1AF2|nr:tetratricopeptide repeat protein [Streptomyces sp. MK7]